MLYAIKQEAGKRSPRGRGDGSNVNVDGKGNVPVDITANVTRDLLQQIEKSGGEVIYYHENFDAIRVNVPLPALERIAESADVRNIRPADRARTNRATPPNAKGGSTPPSSGGAAPPASKSALLEGRRRDD